MNELNNNAKNATKTIFCDIDGTLVRFPDTVEGFKNIPKGKTPLEALPGTLDKLWEWETQGFRIILTTGRKESMRFTTERQLREVGIFWDQLIMGLGPGKRYLVNDINNGSKTAFAVNVERNHGIGSVKLDEQESWSSLTLGEDIACPPPESNPYTDAQKEAYQASVDRHARSIQDYIENGEDISKEPGMELL
jgi:hypothetical protein